MQMKKWSPKNFSEYYHAEHDACGIVASIEKKRIPTKENIMNCINALITMNHRAGFINGEGDGVGIHIDVPKSLWKEKLKANNADPSLVNDPAFTVGHFFISRQNHSQDIAQLKQLLDGFGFQLVYESANQVKEEALGPIARLENPVFWQIAVLGDAADEKAYNAKIFDFIIAAEKNENVHVASFSQHHAVYKVMGAGDLLAKYFKDISSPLIASTMTLGHNRYSTNTLSNFFRVQPFSILGHNGEINTISKLEDEASMLDVPLVDGGSDSQNLNRTIEAFIFQHGYSLFEAIDIAFPPILNEIKSYPDHLQDLYTYIREAWGHFAQGPAAIISRYKDEAVFSVDALGLRPLWMLSTESSYLFSSEPGIMLTSEYVEDPKPLGPGEKVGLKWDGEEIRVYFMEDYQQEVYNRFISRHEIAGVRKQLFPPSIEQPEYRIVEMSNNQITNGQYNAFGWEREHIQLLEQMAVKGAEPIRSLGHDAPLAAMNPSRSNLADFIKESVAVVTNPAIDRDREMEHFSTRTILGKRPALGGGTQIEEIVQLASPILIEGKMGSLASPMVGQPSFEQVVYFFESKKLSYSISTTFTEKENLAQALERINEEVIAAVKEGKTLIILDDKAAHRDGNLWIDPHLVVASVHQALVKKKLRRECSILVRSAAMRSLHDLMIAFGLGANAVSPYYMFTTVYDGEAHPVVNLFSALNKGIEKVISTIGIHELRGYGRLFSSIGLHDEVADVLQIVNFFGSDQVKHNFDFLKQDSIQRAIDYHEESSRIGKSFHLFPRIWKALGDVAKTGDYTAYREKMDEQEQENPTTIRHLTELKKNEKSAVKPSEVNISVGDHSLPFVIASMSFGSQNEIAFRAYAEGADRLNMVSMNGEGGEIKDMLGKYPKTRGQQIASGRFGVNAELLNSSNLLEIKIGQGAKPGEGGHLPGSKVTAKIAEARNATIGSDLISPSNNHDIYSIEDLAQMIHELKTANDQAKVAVKVPVVPNIGTIAVGIAKAGADIITLSGFDGGTGAARIHALQYVGLPVEIGVKAAHNALLEAGLRKKVEIWADGGIKSAKDVLKVMLLGANRVGFGTLSMIAIGCTTCRGCHLDTCHVGIATQIENEVQAKEHGLRRFVPRQFDLAVQGIVNLFSAFGEELKRLAAEMGVKNLQDVVGRSDLLEHAKGLDLLDLSQLLKPITVESMPSMEAAAALEESSLSMAVGAESYDASFSDIRESKEFVGIISNQRVLGSRVSGHRVRGRLDGSYRQLPPVHLSFKKGSIPGNGLAAYNTEGISLSIQGGAQDGVGKTSFGGQIAVLKGKGKDGSFYNGSVGKGFGYGAQSGLLIAQGNADARAGIRLSGADLIIGGQRKVPVPEQEKGNIAVHANIKGFAFEYMTNGRGLVLGDPGPWICAGMTGGVVYLRLDPAIGLTQEALRRRIAKGAKVSMQPLDENGKKDVVELLDSYLAALEDTEQFEEIKWIQSLQSSPEKHFIQVIPAKEQADPSVSTE
ncbi:glutamate synthase-related protein [Bacillus litorisediminis]|uniref:glutamate synthase-related protein n=1 Tax=Bacillus litorisediminis TaxID=2922713 RepID=UPI001FAC5A74|nr:glutamate synthase-related protein [Bacillus litorisediminis]